MPDVADQQKRGPGRPRKERLAPIPEFHLVDNATGESITHGPEEDRKQAFVLAMWQSGSVAVAVEAVNISTVTGQQWVSTAWYRTRLGEVKREADKKLDRKLTSLTEKALEALADRIENGDYRMVQEKVAKGDTPPPPSLMRIPLSAQTLTIAAGVLLDKRGALRKADVEDETTPTEAFERMAAKLRQFAQTPETLVVDDVQTREDTEAEAARIAKENADLE